MKILGINGSPRKGGNTDILLDEVLKGAASAGAVVEKIILDDLKIAPYRQEEYEPQGEEEFFAADDDMRFVYQKINESDVLILASPVFFGSLPAQMKAMIDRFQCVWVAKNIFKKKVFTASKTGAFICVAASEEQKFFRNASEIVKHFFATINTRYKEDLFCPGVDQKGSVRERPEYLERARVLGERMAG
ncbi:MAG: flavodoxin family protein [Candidatus Omnitrophota bacterium]